MRGTCAEVGGCYEFEGREDKAEKAEGLRQDLKLIQRQHSCAGAKVGSHL